MKNGGIKIKMEHHNAKYRKIREKKNEKYTNQM